MSYVRAKEDQLCRERPPILEVHLERCPAGPQRAEDADHVVGTPGPELAAVELDLVPIWPDTQTTRAGYPTPVIEPNPAQPGQIIHLTMIAPETAATMTAHSGTSPCEAATAPRITVISPGKTNPTNAEASSAGKANT